MNICVELLARLLEADERAAVLGDLAELNYGGMKAFRGVAGLVLRRQLALWKDWRPWLALAGLAGVVSPILLIVTAGVMWPLLLTIRTYLRVGSLYSTGLTGVEEVFTFLTVVIGLLLWSWTSGFVMALLSRKTLWITGTLYFLWIAVLLVPLAHLLAPISVLLLTLQAVASAVLFVYPSAKGLQSGLRNGALAARKAALLNAAILCITAIQVWTGGWPSAAVIRWAGGTWDPSPGWPNRLFVYGILALPAAYLLIAAKDTPFAKLEAHGEFRGQ